MRLLAPGELMMMIWYAKLWAKLAKLTTISFLLQTSKVYSKEVLTRVRPDVPDHAPRHVQRYVVRLHHHHLFHLFHHHLPHHHLLHPVPLALTVPWVWQAPPDPTARRDRQDLPDFPAHPVFPDFPVHQLDPQDVTAPWDLLDPPDIK